MARIGLTQLPRKLQQHVQDKHGVSVAAPHYRRCFDSAVSNRFPAEFAGNRWTVAEEDLETIATALGMVKAPAATLVAA